MDPNSRVPVNGKIEISVPTGVSPIPVRTQYVDDDGEILDLEDTTDEEEEGNESTEGLEANVATRTDLDTDEIDDIDEESMKAKMNEIGEDDIKFTLKSADDKSPETEEEGEVSEKPSPPPSTSTQYSLKKGKRNGKGKVDVENLEPTSVETLNLYDRTLRMESEFRSLTTKFDLITHEKETLENELSQKGRAITASTQSLETLLHQFEQMKIEINQKELELNNLKKENQTLSNLRSVNLMTQVRLERSQDLKGSSLEHLQAYYEHRVSRPSRDKTTRKSRPRLELSTERKAKVRQLMDEEKMKVRQYRKIEKELKTLTQSLHEKENGIREIEAELAEYAKEDERSFRIEVRTSELEYQVQNLQKEIKTLRQITKMKSQTLETLQKRVEGWEKKANDMTHLKRGNLQKKKNIQTLKSKLSNLQLENKKKEIEIGFLTDGMGLNNNKRLLNLKKEMEKDKRKQKKLQPQYEEQEGEQQEVQDEDDNNNNKTRRKKKKKKKKKKKEDDDDDNFKVTIPKQHLKDLEATSTTIQFLQEDISYLEQQVQLNEDKYQKLMKTIAEQEVLINEFLYRKKQTQLGMNNIPTIKKKRIKEKRKEQLNKSIRWADSKKENEDDFHNNNTSLDSEDKLNLSLLNLSEKTKEAEFDRQKFIQIYLWKLMKKEEELLLTQRRIFDGVLKEKKSVYHNISQQLREKKRVKDEDDRAHKQRIQLAKDRIIKLSKKLEKTENDYFKIETKLRIEASNLRRKAMELIIDGKKESELLDREDFGDVVVLDDMESIEAYDRVILEQQQEEEEEGETIGEIIKDDEEEEEEGEGELVEIMDD